ncbi:MAG TPA: heparinase II/III family protein [Bacteroidales bacterium]|nr:heparinase II/III family protein [Bacteroidales bacterium]
MKRITGLFLVTILALACNSLRREKESFKPEAPEQIKSEIVTFIEKYNWQHNEDTHWPIISATSEELERLKSAWKSTGPEHDVLAARFARADQALEDTLFFPPEGGQHNQWYQCNDCQIALVTIDAHHHKCPECEKIYTGFPYDNVLYSRQHSRNFSVAEDAAWAWSVTGDVRYAELTASVLKGYAVRYLKYPMVHANVGEKNIDVASRKNDIYRTAGHIAEQTLNESGLMIPLVKSYDLIYKSGVLNDSDKINIEEKLIRAMTDCINVHKSGKSNWQTWHNAALLYAGIILGDKDYVKQAFLDEENGFITQMNISVLPEGMWYENSWGYHYYTLSALTIMAEGSRRLGIDIYSHEMMHKMYLIAFDYLMADGSLPRFGDAVNDTPVNQSVNEEAFAVYKDERLLSTLSSEPTWDMILLGRDKKLKAKPAVSVSKLIPGSGHAILATNGPGKLTAALTFGPYGGFHGHFDKLSFVFFGYGQELGVDPGRAASQAYRLPIHSEWYKATTGHNAVLADGESQKEAEGELLAFEANDAYVAIAAGAGPAFDSIAHKRFLLLGPTYLLVIDELKADDGKEHTFDWLYHNKGTSVSCDMTQTIASPGDLPPGYSYLKEVKAFKVDAGNDINVTFNNETGTTVLTMPDEASDIIFTAKGPLSSVTVRAPLIIVRRKGEIVHFISILEPVPAGKTADVRSLELVQGNSISVKIRRTEGEDVVSFNDGNIGSFKVAKRTSSGETVVLNTSK